MSYGFKVLGDHGIVQIDENYTNLALKQTGSTYVPAGTAGANLAVSGLDTPILCVRTPEGVPINVTSDQSLPVTTYTFRAETATNVVWYVFDHTVPPAGGYGLSVYKSDGSIAYNTDWKVMRIGAIAAVPNATDPYAANMPIGTATAPYAGTWAACLASYRVYIDGGGGGPVAGIHADGIVTGASSASTTDVRVADISWPGSPAVITQPIGSTIFLVDVTGY